MAEAPRKPVIGLLGGVGAGKSTVAAEFARLGCGVIDADAIGHELLKDPAVKEEFRRRWGEGVFGPDGEVDRAAAARAAFADPEDTAALNAIMHPRIRRGIMKRLEVLLADPAVPAVVVDAALLLETDWKDFCTTFVFVSAPDEVRFRRVARQRGWDRQTWQRRENSQKPLDMKRAKADHVISNSSDASCLSERVRSVFQRIVCSAGRP